MFQTTLLLGRQQRPPASFCCCWILRRYCIIIIITTAFHQTSRLLSYSGSNGHYRYSCHGFCSVSRFSRRNNNNNKINPKPRSSFTLFQQHEQQQHDSTDMISQATQPNILGSLIVEEERFVIVDEENNNDNAGSNIFLETNSEAISNGWTTASLSSSSSSVPPPSISIEQQQQRQQQEEEAGIQQRRQLLPSKPISISIQDLVFTPQTELLSGVLVLLSCSLTAISTLPHLPPLLDQSLVQWQEGIAFFLFLEFIAEWWYNISVPQQQQQQQQPTTSGTTEESRRITTSFHDAMKTKTNIHTTTTTSTTPSSQTSLDNSANFLESLTSFGAQQWSYFTKPLVLIDVIVVVLPVLLPLIPDTWWLPTAASTTDEGMLLITGLERWFDEEIPGNMAGSGLINLRLLRLLRWQRVLQDLPTFQSFQSALLGVPSSSVRPVQPYQLQLARVLVSIVTLLSVSAGLIYTTERNVNPQLSDFFSALYFTLTTLTTVGFGDITPMTPQGKMVVSASILAGIAILPAQAASLVDALWKGNDSIQQDAPLPVSEQPSRIASAMDSIPSSSMAVTTSFTTISAAPTKKAVVTTSDEVLGAVSSQPCRVNGDDDRNGSYHPTTSFVTTTDITTTSTDSESSADLLLSPLSLPSLSSQQQQQQRALQLPSLDLHMRCASCDAMTHWSMANYCWSCGNRLKP